LSPIFGGQCRFDPTCSVYALETLDRYPLRKALTKSAKRILSCHPFHRGGYDPVIENEGRSPSGVNDQIINVQMEGSGGERYLLPLL